ncbi:MAG: Asp-tRNA(Asn)/Glu-tRNA(Gln) amidotransferase subunit GatB [Bacteroidia bacterium]|nr:Asp-tRNA(Asn)/Glu-tRNA(Gln) amidotransferase subunit GatB [Bacteroidia bacterium]
MKDRYQPVIGLEIHIQLLTERKMFAPEGFAFASAPNTWISAVTLAHPGALPAPNRAAVGHALRLGLALGCEIDQTCYFSRKNYFYPDLPKGYQLSQDDRPICRHGSVEFPMPDGSIRAIALERIHLEEDAGKSLHDQSPDETFIDLNRAGVGLLELVTRPELHSAEEAGALLAEIRRTVRRLGVGDGNMEAGSLRCDANVSVKRPEDPQLGVRVEVKNINSISFLIRAIQFEIGRQIGLLEAGQAVQRETRTWDVASQRTLSMRVKETADDYRYFPEPDLQPLRIPDAHLEEVRRSLPELPAARFQRYRRELALPVNEALTLAEDPVFSDYFEALRPHAGDDRLAANWMLGPVRSWLNDQQLPPGGFPVQPAMLGQLIALVHAGRISHHLAREQAFPALLAQPDLDLERYVQQLDPGQAGSLTSALETAMQALMAQFPDEVKRYRGGKKGLIGFFVGHLMKQTGGKAQPAEANAVAKRLLESP